MITLIKNSTDTADAKSKLLEKKWSVSKVSSLIEIINDPEWQKENPELYKTLSKYICPHYLPVCTGQRKIKKQASRRISVEL